MADGREGLDGAVAIVGMAGRFPGARDLGELWRNLRGGVESVRFLSREEMAGLGAPATALDDPAWVPAVALPDGIEAKAERMTTKGSIQQYQTTLTLTGIDKQKLGQVAADMHKLRKPDAYKGKGVRYADVPLKLKPGKTGK